MQACNNVHAHAHPHPASRLTHAVQKGRGERGDKVSHTSIWIHIHTNSYTKDHIQYTLTVIHLVSNSNNAQDNRYTRFKITPQPTHASIHNTERDNQLVVSVKVCYALINK